MSLLDSAINTSQLIDLIDDSDMTDEVVTDVSDLTNTRKLIIYNYLSSKGKGKNLSKNYSFSAPSIKTSYEKIDIIKRLLPKLKGDSEQSKYLLSKISRIPMIILEKLI